MEPLFPPPSPDAWAQLYDRLRGPRVFQKDVRRVGDDAQAGGLVSVRDGEGEHLGWALFHPRSQISLRLLSRSTDPLTLEDLRVRAKRAAQRRLDDPSIPNEVCRVLHGEADGFPGLLVDRYGPILAAEAHSLGSVLLFRAILPTLHEALGTEHFQIAFDERSARAEGERPGTKRSDGAPPFLRIDEGGVRYELDFARGHKTGFFCDQRENRASFAALAKDKRVLDVCSYTGGFSLSAAMGGADDVLAIDLDEDAISQAKRNANLNGAAVARRTKFVHADAFSYLRQLQRNERQFDLIAVDPPKFIPNRRSWEEGVARYHDINKLAIGGLAPGGDYLTCSCSGLLTSLELQETVRRSARLAPLQVLRKSGAGPDHPVGLDFPEGEYLKALWMRDTR
ncbi:MAG: class I SAM-dependent rRNA methyltransferase [Planctomycetes bacterium]|nr:class I SAM-dependent rRNA methyltransferase [Planctomycetota bacterium]